LKSARVKVVFAAGHVTHQVTVYDVPGVEVPAERAAAVHVVNTLQQQHSLTQGQPQWCSYGEGELHTRRHPQQSTNYLTRIQERLQQQQQQRSFTLLFPTRWPPQQRLPSCPAAAQAQKSELTKLSAAVS
jgi:hypothetical protein